MYARRGGQGRGLMVAFLGPDGVGKSTVIAGVTAELGDRFPGFRHYHLRPSFGRSQVGGPVVTNPHGEPPRGWVQSVAKLILWWADYLVSYLLFIYPAKRRSTLVLFDRYFDDLLVDPKRYRFGGPMWMARMIRRLVPRPDLVILLDAPPKVVHRRKQEVPLAELTRQTRAYRLLVAGLPNGHIVDAAQPVHFVVQDVCALLLGRAAEDPGGESGVELA